jgi:hypothetical protein
LRIGAGWTQSPNQDFTKDNRGWQKGKRRKWNKIIEERIETIYQFLKSDSRQFYTGATAIEQEWRRRYPKDSPLPLRTIGQILSDLGLPSPFRYGCFDDRLSFGH